MAENKTKHDSLKVNVLYKCKYPQQKKKLTYNFPANFKYCVVNCGCCVQFSIFLNSHHLCLHPVFTVSEELSEKCQWYWFLASQSYQGCGSAVCWSEWYCTAFWLNSLPFSSHRTGRKPTIKVFFCHLMQERVIPSVCWSLGMTDLWRTLFTRTSTQIGIQSSLCQFVSFCFSLITSYGNRSKCCMLSDNKLKQLVMTMGPFVMNIWSFCLSAQPCQRHSWCSSCDCLWWGWRQGARLPGKSCHSSALGIQCLTKVCHADTGLIHLHSVSKLKWSDNTGRLKTC